MASHRYSSNESSRRFTSPADSSRRSAAPDTASLAVTKARSDLGKILAPSPAKNNTSIGTMVKKFMGKGTKLGRVERPVLVIPDDAIAADLKKNATKGSAAVTSLHRKLFQKGDSADRKPLKALTEGKGSTRTLAMVLRSERELLDQNRQYESEISEMQLQLEERNREVEKLKDLCLKQREEIKALKDALLFPDIMNSQLKQLLERKGSETKQEKEIIPELQQQVSSLSGQLQCLIKDLAEVKADKYSGRTCFDGRDNTPKTPKDDHESAYSLEYGSENPNTEFGSLDDMLLNDFNPCLTPCSTNKKSKEFVVKSSTLSPDMSSEYGEKQSWGYATVRKVNDENKWSAGKPRYQNLFGA